MYKIKRWWKYNTFFFKINKKIDKLVQELEVAKREDDTYATLKILAAMHTYAIGMYRATILLHPLNGVQKSSCASSIVLRHKCFEQLKRMTWVQEKKK
jgi:hypothetical protein